MFVDGLPRGFGKPEREVHATEAREGFAI